MVSSRPTRRRVRLCVANGTWQLITLAAALDQDRSELGEWTQPFTQLVLCETEGVADLRSWMDALAPAVWAWDRVGWEFEITKKPSEEGGWPLPLSDWREAFAKRHSLEKVEELWLPHIEGFTHRFLMEVFPDADVVLYEDGYLSPPVVHCVDVSAMIRQAPAMVGLIARGKFRDHLASLRICDWRVSRSSVRRIRQMLFYLSDLPVPPPYARWLVRKVEERRLREAMGKAQEVIQSRAGHDGLEAFAGGRDLLFISQTINRVGMISRDAELALFRGVAASIVEKGYRICWKDHPRESDSFFSELAAGFGPESMIRLPVPPALPVQILKWGAPFRAAVSMNSSALFYLERLQGVKPFTFADEYGRALPKRTSDYLCVPLVLERVPSFRSLPAVRTAGIFRAGMAR